MDCSSLITNIFYIMEHVRSVKLIQGGACEGGFKFRELSRKGKTMQDWIWQLIV